MYSPFIIAEIGVNHGGDLSLAKRLIDDAVEAGADAVKFQVYKADQLAVKDSPAYWDISKESTETQRALFKKFDGLNRSDYEELAKYCKNIEFMATPFSTDDIDWLNPLVKRWKIASADITNTPLLRKVKATGKPVILSTGASTEAEISTAVDILENPALLHCVLNYPTRYENANLSRIKELKSIFPSLTIGYSDHVADMVQLDMAVFIGAEIIEKHFTHDKTLEGNDHYHSMDKHDLKSLKERLNKYSLMYSSSGCSEQLAIINARRSIVAKRDIIAGEVLSEGNLTTKRPGAGISPTQWDLFIGRTAMIDIKADSRLSEDMI